MTAAFVLLRWARLIEPSDHPENTDVPFEVILTPLPSFREPPVNNHDFTDPIDLASSRGHGTLPRIPSESPIPAFDR